MFFFFSYNCWISANENFTCVHKYAANRSIIFNFRKRNLKKNTTRIVHLLLTGAYSLIFPFHEHRGNTRPWSPIVRLSVVLGRIFVDSSYQTKDNFKHINEERRAQSQKSFYFGAENWSDVIISEKKNKTRTQGHYKVLRLWEAPARNYSVSKIEKLTFDPISNLATSFESVIRRTTRQEKFIGIFL